MQATAHNPSMTVSSRAMECRRRRLRLIVSCSDRGAEKMWSLSAQVNWNGKSTATVAKQPSHEFSASSIPVPSAPRSCHRSKLCSCALRTAKTARLALAQVNGVLRNALDSVACSASIKEFRERLEDLLIWEHVARHLDEPWHVVIAGPPNVGKSSLLNAIAGYERSIVFDQPGTTRDAVRTDLIIDGWPFCFVDTAGIRNESDNPIEQEGIRNARSLIETADLVLIAVDRGTGWQSDHSEMLSQIPAAIPRAVVICKADLEPSGDRAPDLLPILETSARRDSGDFLAHHLDQPPVDSTRTDAGHRPARRRNGGRLSIR